MFYRMSLEESCDREGAPAVPEICLIDVIRYQPVSVKYMKRIEEFIL